MWNKFPLANNKIILLIKHPDPTLRLLFRRLCGNPIVVLVSVPVRVQLLPRYHQKSNSGTNCCTKLKWNACLSNVFVQNTQGGWGGGGGGGYAIDGGTLNRIGSIGTSGLLCVLSGVFEWPPPPNNPCFSCQSVEWPGPGPTLRGRRSKKSHANILWTDFCCIFGTQKMNRKTKFIHFHRYGTTKNAL